ncbi:hypothetical protein SVIOM74S_01491 [Streptomyces violarus]
MTGGVNSFQVSGYGPERSGWTRLLARDSVARRLDWPILLSATALSLLGTLLVYSATRNRTELNQGDPYYFLVRHLLNTGIGLALDLPAAQHLQVLRRDPRPDRHRPRRRRAEMAGR